MSNNSKYDLSDLCSFIWRLEKSQNLLSANLLRIPYWPMVRMRAFYSLAICMGLYKNPHPFERDVRWLLKYVGGVVSNALSNIFKFKKLSTANILILEHPRTKKYQNNFIDIYSYFYAKKILNKNPKKSVLILSRTLNGVIDKKDEFVRFNIDIIELGRLGIGVVFGHFLPFGHSLLKQIQTNVNSRPDPVCLRKINTIIKKGWIEFIFTYSAYRILFFFATNASELVMVDAYSSRAGLIAAAKKSGLKVLELQHGVIGEYHLGYSYPSSFNLEYLPDELLVWSGYWKGEIEAVWPGNISIFPNYYLLEQKEKYKNQHERSANSIVVLSQGTISRQLSKLILDNIKHLSKYKIYYKLHPSEVDNWQSDVSLRMLNKCASFSVVESADLFSLFAKCEYQLGVYSTALFEGREFGCKTILANLPGVEYMKNYKPDYWFDDFIGIIENKHQL